MTTFITTLHATGTGPRLAVKDLIDVAGVPSTAGCRAVARTATPAVADAAPPGRRPRRGCGDRRKDEPARAGDVAVGDKPVVRHPGEPAGPVLDRRWILERVSGRGRNPAGRYRAGLRHRRANPSALGVLRNRRGEDDTRPGERAGRAAAGPSLDTVGPTASSVAGVAAGMALLEPGFRPDPTGARVIGRLRTAGYPRIGAAVDDALRAAEFEVSPSTGRVWIGHAVLHRDLLCRSLRQQPGPHRAAPRRGRPGCHRGTLASRRDEGRTT